MSTTAFFRHPLETRYAPEVMRRLWSEDYRILTWRDIWITIARLERELGISISAEQIAAMLAARERINYPRVAELEKDSRHDVMAHAEAYGEECLIAKPIIHLACTSCEITDNADLIIMREALGLLCVGLARAITRLARFAHSFHRLETLGYTHFQAAQLTTVGKRACLWIQDLLLDLAELERLRRELRFRGIKGTTGTQASFLALFDGDHGKVKELDQRFAAAFGFERTFAITGQTYTRKQDTSVLAALASFGASAHKFATDLRLLAHEKEIEEPFGKNQKGSSAMAYKRNPMLSERTCALARHLMSLVQDALHTHATQWLERTLDDSAVRRIAIAEAFLTADAVLLLLQNITEGLVVHPRVIAAHIEQELPFMATENIIVAMVKAGADRAEVHERIRVHSQAAAERVKDEGLSNINNLIELIRSDEFFAPIHAELPGLLNTATFIGRAREQVEEFLEAEVVPALLPYSDQLEGTVELKV